MRIKVQVSWPVEEGCLPVLKINCLLVHLPRGGMGGGGLFRFQPVSVCEGGAGERLERLSAVETILEELTSPNPAGRDSPAEQAEAAAGTAVGTGQQWK